MSTYKKMPKKRKGKTVNSVGTYMLFDIGAVIKTVSGLGKEQKCKVCGKEFLVTCNRNEWVYQRWYTKGVGRRYMCSWTCYRKSANDKDVVKNPRKSPIYV